jgi:arylsulfatase A-like enzyme
MGKQQAVRMERWKGVRFGGTREPVELYDLATDPGETRNVADRHPEIMARVKAVMEEARANSEFNRFWPLPEFRQNQIIQDKHIFDQLEHGIR